MTALEIASVQPPSLLLGILLLVGTSESLQVSLNRFAARRIELRRLSARHQGAPLFFSRPKRRKTIDVDDSIDPEWLDGGNVDENYDNDFDVEAFSTESYSCVVNYNDITVPYVSSLDSESTWISYDEQGGICIPAGPIGQFKEQVSNKLNEPLALVIISASVLASSLLVAISTVDEIVSYQPILLFLENIFNVVFAIDFFARWFSSTRDAGKHVLTLQFALDVAVVLLPLVFGLMPELVGKSSLPAWLTSPSALINLELLRVLRLRRVLRDKQSFLKFERALGIRTEIEDWQLQLARVLLSLFTLLSVSTGLIYTCEHGVNPCISNYFTALYFGLVTLSTVGKCVRWA